MEVRNEWLERYFSITPDLIYFIDLDGLLQYWNASLERLCGLKPEQMKGRPCVEFLCEEDRPIVLADVQKVFANGSHVATYRFIRHDGKLIPFNCNGTVTFNAHGEPDGFAGLGRNITAQLAAEIRLQESEQRFRSLFNNAEVAMFSSRLDGSETLDCNDKFLELVGKARTEVIGQPSVMYWADPSRRAEMVRVLNEQGRVTDFEFGMLNSLGELRYCETSLRLYRERGLLEGSIRDITERKLAEQRVSELLAFNLTILDKSPYGIVVFRKDGQCVMVNNAYISAIGGNTIDNVLSQNFRTLSSWKQHGLLELADKSFNEGVITRCHFDGETTWGKKVIFDAILAPITISEPPHLIVIVHDVTDRITAEQNLKISIRQLEEKELSKSRFLAAASHDLRQPLMAASLLIDILKLSQLTAEQIMTVQNLELAMSGFKNILDAMLNVSKLDSGAIKPELSTIHVTDIFDGLNDIFALQAKKKKVQLNFRAPSKKRLVVHSDIGMLRSVLSNLVANAIKFTSKGNVLVSCQTARKQSAISGMGYGYRYIGREHRKEI